MKKTLIILATALGIMVASHVNAAAPVVTGGALTNRDLNVFCGARQGLGAAGVKWNLVTKATKNGANQLCCSSAAFQHNHPRAKAALGCSVNDVVGKAQEGEVAQTLNSVKSICMNNIGDTGRVLPVLGAQTVKDLKALCCQFPEFQSKHPNASKALNCTLADTKTGANNKAVKAFVADVERLARTAAKLKEQKANQERTATQIAAQQREEAKMQRDEAELAPSAAEEAEVQEEVAADDLSAADAAIEAEANDEVADEDFDY